MPRVRHRSKAVDIDHGQLVYPSLNRFAIVMHLHELAPGGGWAASRRDGWRFQRLAEVCQNLPDRPGLRDEGDQPDVTAAVWALERKLLPKLALASLLGEESRATTAGGAAVGPLPHHLPKAKRVIWLFMTGAPSQVDTWDYKPELQARHGQPLPGADSEVGFFQTTGTCLASPFQWARHGQSGTWVSDLFPHLSKHVDDMCFIHSMHLRANNHAPAAMELMSGFNRPGMPSMGAWLDYGLGSMHHDLPSFVVMHERKPRGDDQIWSAGFLPKSHQALAIDARRPVAIDNLALRTG